MHRIQTNALNNITFDFHCPQCNKTKKIRVHCATTGRGGKKYCDYNCRTKAYRKRREANEQVERQKLGLSELDYKILKLKQKIIIKNKIVMNCPHSIIGHVIIPCIIF